MFQPKTKFDLSPRLKLGVGRGYSKNALLKFSAIVCLTLAVGLAANALRIVLNQQNNNSINGFNPSQPQVLGSTDIKSADQPNQLKFIEYKVQKGDTLFNISQKFNISWGTLASLNNLKSPFTLKPGQSLRIPK